MTRRPIVFINPNSTDAMTEAMVGYARAAVPGSVIDGWTSREGPPAIQGEEDGKKATPHLLELVRQASDEGAGAVVIGCFDDTGLAQARARAACPVIGLGQAAYHVATLLAERFSVVTTLPVSVPVISGNIRAQGFADNLGRVRASGIPVLELDEAPDLAFIRLTGEVEAVVREDQVGAVVLGCAGMSRFAERLRVAHRVAVVDPVEAAARLAALLLALGSVAPAPARPHRPIWAGPSVPS